jgi:hypothetical protein
MSYLIDSFHFKVGLLPKDTTYFLDESLVKISNKNFDNKTAFHCFERLDLQSNFFSQDVEAYPRRISEFNLIDNTFKNLIIEKFKDHSMYDGVSFFSFHNEYQVLSMKYFRNIPFKSFYDRIKVLLISNADFNTFIMHKGSVDSILFNSVSYSSKIRFDSCTIQYLGLRSLPDTILFINSYIGNWPVPNANQGNRPIFYIDGDFNFAKPLIQKPYSSYRLFFGRDLNLLELEKFLKRLLILQESIGTSEDVKEVDILLKDVQIKRGDFTLWLQKHLWLYGYDKALAIKWFFYSFMLFFVINLFLFKTLITKVYKIENLHKEFSNNVIKLKVSVRLLKYVSFVFIYSSLIYFGIKMNIENFTFKKIFLTFYLYFFYLLGLFFLFYVLGFLLSK